MTKHFSLFLIFQAVLFLSLTANPLFSPDSSQSCTGSLGENIFTDGDFGSGTSNLLTANPGIAPGYNYTTNPPPNDGQYTITNNTGQWGNLYGTWLKTRDNSNDPNGYFMVVNASYDPGLFYEKKVDGLCANTQYEFSVDVLNLIQRNVTNHIKPDVDMLLDGQVVLSTGPIDQNEQWNHYSVSFCTGPGQTSLTLSIRNNAPGGIGNDLGLDNISFRPCGPDAFILPQDTSVVCLDDNQPPLVLTASISDPSFKAVQWQWSNDNGMSWQDITGADQLNYTLTDFPGGSYIYRYLLAVDPANLNNNKCRLISEDKTVIAFPTFYEFNDTICEGSSLMVGNSTYTQAGTYVDSLISSYGCDSIVTTNLAVVAHPGTQPLIETRPPDCFGEANASIVALNVPQGIAPFTYSLDGALPNSTGIFTDLTAGNYQLEVLDKYGCRFQSDIGIGDPPLLLVTTTEDTTLGFGEVLPISSLSNYSDVTYSWMPEEGLSCTNCPDPLASPANATAYIVTVTNDAGCTARDTLSIRVEKANFLVHTPSGFTPNGDGVNDYFTIIAKTPAAIRQIRQFAVFNRWGRTVYLEAGDANSQQLVNWDGYSSGKPVPEGTYVFVLRLELIDDRELDYSGTVTVLR